MRRYVLILMMLTLPLQWSWAVAASICQHEVTGKSAHLGHHEHEHTKTVKVADPSATEAPQGYDADCATCHGQCSLASLDVAGLPLPPVGSLFHSDFARFMPDHVPDGLLRPPLSHLV